MLFRSTGGFTHLVTPRIVNEARLNLSDSSVLSAYMLDSFLGAQPIAPAIAYPPGLSPANTQLQISLTAISSTLFLGPTSFLEQRQINGTDAVSWTAGSHQLKFGGDLRVLLPYQAPKATLSYTFPTVPSLIANAASSFSYSNSSGVRGNMTNASIYAQDTLRLAAKLTLAYGVRWEMNTAPRNLAANNGTYV